MTILHWVALAALQTAVFWLPYVGERILRNGLLAAVGNPPTQGYEAAQWAVRARAAHANAIENLVIFAALALAAQLAGVGASATTQWAGSLYVVARLLHFVVYTAGIPWLRTLAFAGGFAAQVMLAIEVLR